ncbi:MAG: hypothetical protein ACYC6Y_24975 [Thermoguttaceae bacterium]
MDLVGAILIGIVLSCGGVYVTWISWGAWQELRKYPQTVHRRGGPAPLSAWLQHGATLLISLVFLGAAASVGLSMIEGDSWANARADLKLLAAQMLADETPAWSKAGRQGSFHVTVTPQGKRITGISACYTQFDDSDLEQVLDDYADIHWFLLSGTQVDDRAMRLLAQRRNLSALVLARTSITDRGVAFLEGHCRLEELDLTRTAITDQALAAIGSLPSLKHLNLGQTGVTDEGLKVLRGNTTLSTLNLGGTRTTDGVVDTLVTLDHLNVLHVRTEDLSGTALARLKQALPQCEVQIDTPLPPQ